MNDQLSALKLFVLVARLGSLSRAGREMGMSQPSASRTIAALEEEVGVKLLVRTTRAITLTEAGTGYLARIEALLDSLEEADHAARGTGELRGTLRVGVAASFAIREIIPQLPQFMRKHPELRIDLVMDDQKQDLVGERIDVAIRLGMLADSTATSKLLGTTSRVLVASPEYLRSAGIPSAPADLAAHAFIIGSGGRPAASWTFERAGKTVSVRADGRLHVTVNAAAIAAALAGLGIASTSLWGCRSELQAGTLVQVLPDWKLPIIEAHAVFTAGRAANPSARAFANYLADYFRESAAA